MTLAIERLSAGYGRRTVLSDVSVPRIAAGAFVGVIGPNASGKSTLFKAVAGLLAPRGGTIRLDDDDVAAMPRWLRARSVAYMPQAFGCNALLTVFESVLLALKQTTGWRVDDDNLDRVADTLSALGLSHIADRGIADLSGGQAQMVAVAQTLVRAPRVVLLDEPTSALDLHHQLSIMESVRQEMQARGTIVMAALHDLNLAAQFCDRLILISEGRILADGAPSRVLGLAEIGRTYRVTTTLETTRRGTLFVDAMLGGACARSNYGLKDGIRDYWSARATTFDASASHRIEDRYGLPEWHRLIRSALDLGPRDRLDGLRALDIACGTGEISRVLTGLGAEVTGLDFSETMLAQARDKLTGRDWTAVQADAEAMAPLPAAGFDLAVTRHLAWTLTDPHAAYREWHRVLRPGGRLLVVDGNFRAPRGLTTRLRRWLADRLGPPAERGATDRERHASILDRLPYATGLTEARLRADLEAAGFGTVHSLSVAALYGRGMRAHPLGERLRLSAEHRFALVAVR